MANLRPNLHYRLYLYSGPLVQSQSFDKVSTHNKRFNLSQFYTQPLPTSTQPRALRLLISLYGKDLDQDKPIAGIATDILRSALLFTTEWPP